jgi:hypothetical protein
MLIRKRNSKKTTISNSVDYRKEQLGEKDRDMSLLEHCCTLWQNLEPFRRRRARAMRFVYGDQWGDTITVKGKTMTERQYLTSVGNVALQTNQLKKIVETISGMYAKESNEPVCKARAREEQIYGELMTIALQANWQMNDMPLMIDTIIKESLIGGLGVTRECYEYRDGDLDSWTDVCHPNYMIIDSTMKDPRYKDMELIGEIHDITFGRFCEKFATSREDVEKFAEWYRSESSPLWFEEVVEDINDKHNSDEMTFWTPKDKDLCRVYEIWRKESRDRYRVHDENTGELYMINADDTESIANIEAENKVRLAMGLAQGWPEEDIPLIRYKENFFVDTYWYGRFMTPQGYILWEGASPYEERRHPYSVIMLPMVDGQITSYLCDAIDQNIAINRLLTLHDWMLRAGLKGVTFVPADIVPENMSNDEFAEQFTTIDGIVFYEPKKHQQKPETFYGHTSSLNLAEIVRMMSDLMESSVSVNSAIRGDDVKSGTAAALYAQQTQQAATPLAALMMRLGIFVKHVARLKLANIQNFYDPKRFDDIAGTLSTASMEKSIDYKLAGNIEYDLAIAQSTATPTYRALKTQILMDFASAGFIPPRFVFEFGDVPGGDEILQRLDAMEQAAQQSQEMAAEQPIGEDYEQKKDMLSAIG